VDEHGRFIYRTGVLQRMKGWGKDPLLAVICLVEFVGPSRVKMSAFGPEFGQDGHPIGTHCVEAWVQIAAVNQQQTRNTMRLIPSLMSQKLIDTYSIKPGAELTRALNGKAHMEAVTSSYRALEGGRTTFTLMNETHHWISGNNGHEMYETIDGNATKMDNRYLAITNAYLPGEDSVAERMRDAWQKIQDGKSVDIGFLYDSIEAHPLTPLTPEALRIVLPKIRGDATWLNVETIIQSVLNTTMAPSRSRRMWLNQIVAEEDAVYGPQDWLPLETEGAILNPGDEIVLGFDGGKTDDATALVALRIKDMTAFVLCLEEKPEGPAGDHWSVSREKVDSAVHSAFRLYKVRAFYADVALWESYIDDWAEMYREVLTTKASERHAIAWDMRQSVQKVTRAHERIMQSVFDGKLHHDGDPDLRRHVLNARRRENNYGVSFGKESRESPRKVDLYAALMLAHEALHDYRTRGKKAKQRSGAGYFF
jgi:phage terminase large subunit-like protein